MKRNQLYLMVAKPVSSYIVFWMLKWLTCKDVVCCYINWFKIARSRSYCISCVHKLVTVEVKKTIWGIFWPLNCLLLSRDATFPDLTFLALLSWSYVLSITTFLRVDSAGSAKQPVMFWSYFDNRCNSYLCIEMIRLIFSFVNICLKGQLVL